MRSDLIIDGFVSGSATVGGDDATRQLAGMNRRLRRNDVNVLLLSGCIISMYNIVDIDGLARETGLPVVCLTYRESKGIEDALVRHFPGGYERKLTAYRKLGERYRVSLRTGYGIFVRSAGLSTREAERVLNNFTLQGAVPEPVRLAKLLAGVVSLTAES